MPKLSPFVYALAISLCMLMMTASHAAAFCCHASLCWPGQASSMKSLLHCKDVRLLLCKGASFLKYVAHLCHRP